MVKRSLKAKIALLQRGVSKMPNVSMGSVSIREAVWQTYISKAGSDAAEQRTTAVRKGDRYVLNGEKVWISLADVADHFIVFAWTDQEKKKNRDHKGLSAIGISVPER